MNETTTSNAQPTAENPARVTWHVDDVDWTPLTGLFIQKAGYKTVVPPEFSNGAYSIELTTVGAGGSSPTHKEPWAHVFYVLSGQGEVTVEDEVKQVRAGSVSPISAGQAHSFRNTGPQPLEMLVIYHPPRKRKA
ncbi:cupin domain-containing protein [Pusillimonas noertemannii]|uniref:cupin domain-containing protein n=1 Tax=Pusillimonas noertemannii TaxID=305977 RepID=UPI0012FE29E9|nr:cupin domain-containing protein [Pusillimonas noertemannii]